MANEVISLEAWDAATSAAPELLDACKRAIKAIRVGIESKGGMSNAYDDNALLACNAAIAKAEGK